MFVQSDYLHSINNNIMNSKYNEILLLKNSLPQNSINSVTVVINIAEYSNAPKKFIQDQQLYKNKNVRLFVAEYDKIKEFYNEFYFLDEIKLKNIFYNEICYSTILSKNDIYNMLCDNYKCQNIGTNIIVIYM